MFHCAILLRYPTKSASRLAGVNTVEEANASLSEYLRGYNRKFRVVPSNKTDVHVKPERGFNLDRSLCKRSNRTVRNDNTIAHEGKLYQIIEKVLSRKVVVEEVWHGSLNILSHRYTSESMIRFSGQAMAETVTKFFAWSHKKDKQESDIFLVGNPVCPKCGWPSIAKTGKYGPFFKCENANCGITFDLRNKRRTVKAKALDGNKKSRKRSVRPSKACPEPGCGGQMISRNGRYGGFLGCSHYPKCRYTENIGN